jgi:hypothetical protein
MGAEPKKRGLTDAQWLEVRTRYEAGEAVLAIANRLGARRQTIMDRAKREGWTAHATAHTAQVSGRLEETAEETDEEWSAPQRRNSAPKGTNWFAERDLYVTGNESYADIAKRLGLNEGSVKQVACDREHIANNGKTWAEHRLEFRESVSGETLEREKETQVLRTLTVNAAQRSMAEDLVNTAFPKAIAALAGDEIEAKERVRLTIAALALQRRIHGLDKAPVRLEMTGKDGGKIEHDVMLETDIPEDVKALGERYLDLLFGERAIDDRVV